LAALARSRRGDREPLRHFIASALDSDACQAANLNYWAYWIGEVPETHSSDEFMAGDLGPWSGAALLLLLLVDRFGHAADRLGEHRLGGGEVETHMGVAAGAEGEAGA
jgi:hypothetical protein